MEFLNYKVYELKEIIVKKEVFVEEVIKVYLDKVENVDLKVDVFLYVVKEEVLKDVKVLDEKLNKGEEFGILGGVFLGIKDNISVKNM